MARIKTKTTFKAKMRHVGNSLGILIPKEEADKLYLRNGEEIQVTIKSLDGKRPLYYDGEAAELTGRLREHGFTQEEIDDFLNYTIVKSYCQNLAPNKTIDQTIREHQTPERTKDIIDNGEKVSKVAFQILREIDKENIDNKPEDKK